MTGRAATARRLYLHVLDNGTVTARDIGRLVETIEQLEAENARLRQQQANEGRADEALVYHILPVDDRKEGGR